MLRFVYWGILDDSKGFKLLIVIIFLTQMLIIVKKNDVGFVSPYDSSNLEKESYYDIDSIDSLFPLNSRMKFKQLGMIPCICN